MSPSASLRCAYCQNHWDDLKGNINKKFSMMRFLLIFLQLSHNTDRQLQWSQIKSIQAAFGSKRIIWKGVPYFLYRRLVHCSALYSSQTGWSHSLHPLLCKKWCAWSQCLGILLFLYIFTKAPFLVMMIVITTVYIVWYCCIHYWHLHMENIFVYFSNAVRVWPENWFENKVMFCLGRKKNQG